MKRGEYHDACPKLAESQRLDPSAGTLLNLSICERELGHLATAWTKFRELVDTTPRSDPRVTLAVQAISELEPQLPRLRITVREQPAGSYVTLDGVELRAASLGRYVPVDPGEHRIALVISADSVDEKHLRIAVGERAETELSRPEQTVQSPQSERASVGAQRLKPAPTTSAPASRTRSVEQVSPPLAAYVAGGIGAASIVTAGVFGAIALHEHSVVTEHCPGGACDREGYDAAQAGLTHARLALIASAIGVVGLGTGGFLLWQAHSQRAQVTAGAGGAVLLIRGSFE